MAERRVAPGDFDFDAAPSFRKTATLLRECIVVATGGEIVHTVHLQKDGKTYIETTNIAKPGDRIISRTPEDRYIMSEEKFNALYEEDGKNPKQYRSKNIVQAVLVTDDVVIYTSWGEDQHIKAGGVICQSRAGGDVYGNQAYSFEEDFARLAAEGSLLPLTSPLHEQEEWARNLNEVAHLRDIAARKAFFKKD